MIKIDEVKEVLSAWDNIKDIQVSSSRIDFKYNDSTFSLSVRDKDEVVASKMILFNAFRSPKKFVTINEGDKIAEKTNLVSNSPCKVVYVGVKDDDGIFLTRNVFTDKLDTFPDVEEIGDLRRANLKVLILGMMLENYACYRDIETSINTMAGEDENESK